MWSRVAQHPVHTMVSIKMDLRYNYILGDSYVYCIYLESYHLWSLGCVHFKILDS